MNKHLTETAKQSCIFYSEKGLLFRAWTGSGRNIENLSIKREDEENWGEEENLEFLIAVINIYR